MPLTCLTPVQDIDKQYVGFATLPNQVHRKSVKKGFDFTLMVAGECTRPQRGQGYGQPGSVWGLGPDLPTASVGRGVRPGEVHTGPQPLPD